MLIGVGVSCRFSYTINSYVYASGGGSITSVGEERASFFLLSFTCNYVVSVTVSRGFLFLLVLGIGCGILLGHSLGMHIIILQGKKLYQCFTMASTVQMDSSY